MVLTQKHVEDLETLRAFTHPLRMRLLATLRFDRPATASISADGWASPCATSYHLRQLARFVHRGGRRATLASRTTVEGRPRVDLVGADGLVDDPAARTVLRIRERIRFMVEQLRRLREGRCALVLGMGGRCSGLGHGDPDAPEDLDRMGREIWDVVTRARTPSTRRTTWRRRRSSSSCTRCRPGTLSRERARTGPRPAALPRCPHCGGSRSGW